MTLPGFLLRQLYVKGSLRADGDGVRFTLRNGFMNTTLTAVRSLRVAGQEVSPERVALRMDGQDVDPQRLAGGEPLVFARGAEAEVRVAGLGVKPGQKAEVRLAIATKEFDELVLEFEDTLATG